MAKPVMQSVPEADFEDKVPEYLRDSYVLVDGNYKLELDGHDTLRTAFENQKSLAQRRATEVSNLKDANEKLEQRLAALEADASASDADKKASSFGKTGEEWERAVKAAAKEIAADDIKKLQENLEAQAAKAKDFETKYNDLGATVKKDKVMSALQREAVASGCWPTSDRPKAAERVASELFNMGFTELGQDGESPVAVRDGIPIPSLNGSGSLSLPEALGKIYEAEPYLRPAPSGAATPPAHARSRQNGGSEKGDPTKWSQQEKLDFFEDHPGDEGRELYNSMLRESVAEGAVS